MRIRSVLSPFCLGLLAAGSSSFAQTNTTTPAVLDVGGIRAKHYPIGDMWWDPAQTRYNGLEFPKGDTSQVGGFGGIVFGGRNAQGALAVSANVYRDSSSNFSPGPIVVGSSADIAASAAAWSRIWSVSSATIDAFLGNPGATTISPEILEWPAKGNAYARGANGQLLSPSDDYAPFVDVDQDGIYDPYKGDYPKIKGSQMLWWMFHDGNGSGPWGAAPVLAQVGVSAYAYSVGTIADNAIFYEYDVQSLSGTMTDFHFAAFSDLDIRYAFNDYSAVDSQRRLGLIYNGSMENFAAGSRDVAAGIIMCEQPGDTYATRQPLRNINQLQVGGNTAVSYYQQLSAAQVRTGLGDPAGDLCVTLGHMPGDRNLLLSSQAMTLPGRTHARFGYALVIADGAGHCPTVSLNDALTTADTAYERYWHATRVTPRGNPAFVSGQVARRFSIYPNPANTVLNIESPMELRSIRVTNMLGAVVPAPMTITAAGAQLNTKGLAPGIYGLQMTNLAGERSATTFIKD